MEPLATAYSPRLTPPGGQNLRIFTERVPSGCWVDGTREIIAPYAYMSSAPAEGMDSRNCDVIVSRWRKVTDMKGLLSRDGRTFRRLEQEQAEAAAGIARCRREIAEIEASIRAGHPDVEGLCLALADWSAELRLIEGKRPSRPA